MLPLGHYLPGQASSFLRGDSMRICENGVYRDATAEEESELSPMTKGSQPMTEEERLADLESRISALEKQLNQAKK